MLKVNVSRWVNYYLLRGRKDEMVSSRVYRECRYGWRLCIDWWFYVLRGDIDHCRCMYWWEKGVNDDLS